MKVDCQYDVVIIGSGPAGIAAACECQNRGLSYLIIDRAGLAQSFSEYPHNLQFFSPPYEMELGNYPLAVAGGLKPTRETYLSYLRGIARSAQLNLASWERIIDFKRHEDQWLIKTKRVPNNLSGRSVMAKFVIVATGLWHKPYMLGCSGENLPHVKKELFDPTPYYGKKILVIGGGNSAVGGALLFAEAGAKVSLSMRRVPKNYRSGLRPFVKRDLSFATEEGKVKLYAETRVKEIGVGYVTLEPVSYTGENDLREGSNDDYVVTGELFDVEADFVFALIGHQPDTDFLKETIGLKLRPDGRPQSAAGTWETTQPGVYVAGSLADHEIDIVLMIKTQSVKVVEAIAERLK